MIARRWHVLADLVKAYGLTRGAEIGVAEGRFSAALLSFCPEVTLFGVDSFAPGYRNSNGTLWTNDRHAENRASAHAVLNSFAPRFVLVERPSLEAADEFGDGSLDFVFIDADHSYEGCKADIEAWTPKVRDGGWITGHDFDHRKWPGVVRAVEESFSDFHIKDDFVWIAQQ